MRARLVSPEIELEPGRVIREQNYRDAEGHIEAHHEIWEALIYLSKRLKYIEQMAEGEDE